METLYKVKEAADILKVCERSIKNWLRSGDMKGFKAGAKWRIPHSELERYQKDRSN